MPINGWMYMNPPSPPLLLLKGNAALFRLVPGYGLSFWWSFGAKIEEKSEWNVVIFPMDPNTV